MITASPDYLMSAFVIALVIIGGNALWYWRRYRQLRRQQGDE